MESTANRNLTNASFESNSYDSKLEGGIFSQYKALLVRNLVIKKREKKKTITEFLMPLYCIFILAVVRMFVKETTYEAITEPHDGSYLRYNNNHLLLGNIFVTPMTDMVHAIMDELPNFIDFSPENVLYFPNEDELIQQYLEDSNMTVALVFTEDPIRNPVYTIRINPSITHLVQPSNKWTLGEQCRGSYPTGLEDGISCPPNSYYKSGFLALQSAIDFTITKLKTNKTIPSVKLFLQSFPRNEFVTLGSAIVLRSLVPMYMVFAWAQFINYMMILIVEEKEKKIKEGMMMMGLRGSVYWLSWVTIYLCYVILLAIICIIVLPLANVFLYANLPLLFILFVLYGLSSIMLALMLTPFFNNAKMAGIVGQLLQVMLSLLFYVQVYLSDKISRSSFWLLGLLSPCAFSMAIDKVILFDFSEGGLNWSNVWEGDGLPFAGSLIMITVDIFLYLALGYYFDDVIPSNFGSKQKPWFIFKKSTWVKSSNRSQSHKDIPMSASTSHSNHDFDPTDTTPEGNPDVEPFPAEWRGREAVRIRNLRKTFKRRGNNDVHAVDGISMDIYEGQITAILGHNGAGKTTLFNMLTGMISPSEGKASIFGFDINDPNDVSEIRKLTGVCPQHDILFMTLTPREHLTFYARMKGIRDCELKIREMLKDLDLTSKADTKADQLSGGQKRKLSIGIALIGDPKILFLDEPTAGVDAYSRRHLWALLKKNKKGKVTLLTTHFMDEADILADRKAVVSRGTLRCYGTSFFLKNKFGLGYHLTLVIDDSVSDAAKVAERLVKKVIPTAELARHFGKELSFVLPSAATPLFRCLFSDLDVNIADADRSHTRIESYGISMTTLEEVFLALNKEVESEEDVGAIENVTRRLIRTKSSTSIGSASAHGKGAPNSQNQNGFLFHEVQIEKKKRWGALTALVKLRFRGFSRELGAVFFLVVFPLILVALSIGLTSFLSSNNASKHGGDPERLLLTSDMYWSLENRIVLVNNMTGHPLTPLDATLSHFRLLSSLYNGSYDFIYNSQPHFSAFDLFKFFDESAVDATIRYNTTLTHILPILNNLLNNAILSGLSGSVSGANDTVLAVNSQQMPSFAGGEKLGSGSFFAPIMIGFVFTMIPAGLVIDVVYDRQINARNLLRLNGVGFGVYYASFLSVIGSLYLVSYVGLLVIIQAFSVPSLSTPLAFSTIALLYLLYMPPSLLFSCCASYLFDKQETARQFYPSIVTTIGFVCYIVVALLDVMSKSNAVWPLHVLFTIFLPYYIPFGALYFINKVYIQCSLLGACSQLTVRDYMSGEIVVMFVMCVVDVFVFYVLLKVIDTVKLGGSVRDALPMKSTSVSYSQLSEVQSERSYEDADVKEERDKIRVALNNGQTDSPAILYNVGKAYRKKDRKAACSQSKEKKRAEKPALRSVSFEIRPGEVFGLLGPNGAGKTSTIRIMTAEETPTNGQVTVCGYNITSSLSSAYEHLGYCPQFDCLWKNISVDEHIECFAQISGVKQEQIKSLTDAYINGLEIGEHRKKLSKNCSGGTKRKLSYILSMMGRPKIVLMDEPSTGMDPQSKRFLWNSILASFKGERSALLTTHSMEEADVLCSTIGILVKGELRCLGSVQHLKNKYGSGYNLEMKLAKKPTLFPTTVSVEDFSIGVEESSAAPVDEERSPKATISHLFPNSTVSEEFDERIIFNIPQEDIKSLAQVFYVLESLKEKKMVEEYALSQTSLEQVFLRFARLQEIEEEEEGVEHEGSGQGNTNVSAAAAYI